MSVSGMRDQFVKCRFCRCGTIADGLTCRRLDHLTGPQSRFAPDDFLVVSGLQPWHARFHSRSGAAALARTARRLLPPRKTVEARASGLCVARRETRNE